MDIGTSFLQVQPSEISLPDNLQDINFWNSWKGVLTHRELVDIEGPNRGGAIGESLKNSHRIPVVHGDGDLRFQQLHDLLTCLRPCCIRAANHLEKDVHMSDQLSWSSLKGSLTSPE